MSIFIVNKKTHKATDRDWYCARGRNGSALANKYDWRGSEYAEFQVKDRDEALARYEDWFYEQIAAKNQKVLDELRKIYKLAVRGDVYLVCWCSPENCHCSTIRHFIEEALTKTRLR